MDIARTTFVRNYRRAPLHAARAEQDRSPTQIQPSILRASRSQELSSKTGTSSPQRQIPRAREAPASPKDVSPALYTSVGRASSGQAVTEDPLDTDQESSASSDEERREPSEGRKHSGLLTVLCGAVAFVVIYTLIFWVGVTWITVSNRFTYGSVHTSHLDTRFGTTPVHVTAWNEHGSIKVSISERGQPDRVYQGPALEPSAWGNLDAIVATVSVQPVKSQARPTLVVHLIGDVNYWRPFFARPTLDFQLVPDEKSGYRLES